MKIKSLIWPALLVLMAAVFATGCEPATPPPKPADTETNGDEPPMEEPAETPAEEPAETPAEEPAVTPAEEPAVTPAEEPAETPAEEPAEKPVEEKPAKELPEEKPAEEKPAEEKPAEEKPAEEKPAEEKPAEEKPAEEKPAEEKPVEEKPAKELPPEKPAEEKPAGEKPAEEKPAEEPKDTPAAEPSDSSATTKPPATLVAAKPADPSKAGGRVTAGDWPMWGGSIDRNMVNTTTNVTLDFKPAQNVEDAKNMSWITTLGSQTYGNPIVAAGKVFVGTNNGGGYRPKHPANEDRGVVLCFDEKTGDFLWQLTREKLPQGRVNDWPEQGICSTPVIEGDRMWVVTNRCELMCVDINGFHDGENDGPFTAESDAEKQDADIVWVLDMIQELGVFPHNLATSSPVIYEDMVYLLTSNGVDEAHLEIPAPRSPSFLAVNKVTGEIVWEDNTPFDQILHGQWSSPSIGVVNGQAQVYMPGGDGWLYAFDAKTGEHIWKFDLNPKDSKWELGGRGTRNAIISTPVFHNNSVVLGVGQDPEHGEGVGHLYRIDATKKGDVSPVTEDGQPNPNSGQIWHFGGVDEDGSVTGEKGRLIFRRTISSVAIHDGLVYAPDLTGYLHCLDFETGKRYWEHDMLAAVWGSPMVVDGKVMLGDEDGDLVILKASKEKEKLDEKLFSSSIYSTPTLANGRLYISDRSRLYAFDVAK